MDRGNIVIVKDFRGQLLRRVVWEEFGTSVIVCTETEYKNWQQTGLEPKVVGFPYEDVEREPAISV